MTRFFPSCAAILLIWTSQAAAQPVQTAEIIDCRGAAELAEQEQGLPAGLLYAIGKIETGRPNPLTGQVEPYPWATNQAGIDHWFNSAAEAVAWTATTQAHGMRSIDVGCFQINLMYHPDAFATLEEAFDPLANARYAARFLAALYRRAGGWPLAVAQYHSADPALGGPYGDRVYSAWNGTWPGGSFQGGSGRVAVSARIGGGPGADPVVIRVSMQAVGIRVVLPGWATAPAIAPAPRAQPAAVQPAHSPAAGAPGNTRTAQLNAGNTAGFDPVGGRIRPGGHLPRVYRP